MNWRLASETRWNGGFFLGLVRALAFDKKSRGPHGWRLCSDVKENNWTYVLFVLFAFCRAAFSRCIWAMSSRASSSVISWVPFWSHGRGKY